MNVMESAVQKGLKRFVYASSIGYYGVNVEGRLMPEYLPIDEKIRIAAIDGACDGKLNSYNQSKVMAEQICAYYGTNRMIETIVLRLAPANDLEDQYREGEDIPYGNYQEKCFWANVDLINVEQAFVKAVKYSGAGFYDVFNIGNRRIYGRIPVRHWLEDKYPGVPTFCSNHESLYSIEKARSKLGYEPTR
jgi:nucleoside-diphosphate-sugar epimerase